jgi:RNA polymerase sigma factor (sigma-70 family)
VNLPSGDEDLAAVPSIGRAHGLEPSPAPEADLTRSLYERHANQIFRYCLHQLGSREEAEDAVQSTFLNAFRGIRRGVVPELESAWLFKIARNVCLSRRRSAWRRGRIESPTDFDLVEELVPAPSRRADELIGLQDVLERMPDAQRRAILLREWQGLSYREIADELSLSQAAVETLIFRARRSLAAGLEQPLEPRRRRIARAFDWSNLVTGLKSLVLGSSVAAKVAATVAVVGATTVAATAPIVQHRLHRPLPPAPKPTTHAHVARTVVHTHAEPPVAPAPVSPSVSVPIAQAPHRHARSVLHHGLGAGRHHGGGAAVAAVAEASAGQTHAGGKDARFGSPPTSHGANGAAKKVQHAAARAQGERASQAAHGNGKAKGHAGVGAVMAHAKPETAVPASAPAPPTLDSAQSPPQSAPAAGASQGHSHGNGNATGRSNGDGAAKGDAHGNGKSGG